MRRGAAQSRRAFTLVELLVSITVFLILTGLTLVMVNNTFEAERLRSGTRQVQSYLEGARDRAIHAGEPRGVRFLYDPTTDTTDPRNITVSSMVYVKPLANDAGTCTIAVDPTSMPANQLLVVEQEGAATWPTLARAGVLTANSRIHIDLGPGGQSAYDGSPYGIDAAKTFNMDGTLINDMPPQLVLVREHVGTGAPGGGFAYELELGNAALPNSEPVVLPEGIAIHMGNAMGDGLGTAVSQIPTSWITAPGQMDLVFSPRGVITGPPAAQGIIHLVLCDLEDVPDTSPSNDRVAQFFAAGTEATFLLAEGGLRLATIFTRTGRVSTHQVDPNSGDPFNYAISGEVTSE